MPGLLAGIILGNGAAANGEAANGEAKGETIENILYYAINNSR